jgi:predicted transcriptional regulator
MPAREVQVPERPDLYVVARFLARLREPDRTHTRSSLQAAVRVNYDLFRAYLAWLLERGFVTVKPVEGGSDEIRLTREGFEAHGRLVSWVRDVLGDRFL